MSSMKKSMFMMALAAMSLASCSNDSVVEVPQPDAIKFNVLTQRGSRASAIYSEENTMNDFYVYATYNPTTGNSVSYMVGDKVVKSGDSWIFANDVTRYWADEGTLDFYAFKNADVASFTTWAAGSAPTIDFTVNDDVTKQNDLLYAVKLAQTKDANSSSGVILKFQHALSQIVVKAKNSNSGFEVKINGIKIGQVKGQGTYTLPAANTDGTYTPVDWSLAGDAKDYSYNLATAQAVTSELVTVGGTEQVFLLLPQKTTAWTPTDGGSYNGSYIAVNCEIWNVAGTDKVPLHIGWAVMPVGFDWKQGKIYTYNLNFGGYSNGGYEDNPTDPTPIITPISFTVDVADFDEVKPSTEVGV